jgi:hypothetical protein
MIFARLALHGRNLDTLKSRMALRALNVALLHELNMPLELGDS